MRLCPLSVSQSVPESVQLSTPESVLEPTPESTPKSIRHSSSLVSIDVNTALLDSTLSDLAAVAVLLLACTANSPIIIPRTRQNPVPTLPSDETQPFLSQGRRMSARYNTSFIRNVKTDPNQIRGHDSNLARENGC
ncbi:hypothetical protein E4U53_007172 [Claviceps sorghi]|nr:hypothetical protein E4U53_007172 [Claviceps sorghi]